jgi:hypothetical protein
MTGFPIYFPKRRSERGNTAAALTALNEVLLEKEWCVETDTGRAKIGDGVTAWNDLDYFAQSAIQFKDEGSDEGTLGGIIVVDFVGAGVTVTEAGGVLTVTISGSGGGGGGVGSQAGYAYAESAALQNSTSIIPSDNTIPQSGEGDHIAALDVTYTPTNAASILEITFEAPIAAMSAVGTSIYSMFRDAGANAIAASYAPTGAGGGYNSPVRLVARVAAGSVTPTTFKMRFGPNYGVTSYLNSLDGSTALYGGSAVASLTVREILQ